MTRDGVEITVAALVQLGPFVPFVVVALMVLTNMLVITPSRALGRLLWRVCHG